MNTLNEWNISVRLAGLLTRAGILTRADLEARTSREIQELPGMGRTTYAELCFLMHEEGVLFAHSHSAPPLLTKRQIAAFGTARTHLIRQLEEEVRVLKVEVQYRKDLLAETYARLDDTTRTLDQYAQQIARLTQQVAQATKEPE